MSKATQALKNIFNRINKALKEAVSNKEMNELATFSLSLIVKRTRLGYGVNKQFGSKKKLKPLSEKYKNFRRKFAGLAESTTASKSNLTLTGQMLESMDVIKAKDGQIVLAPTGTRSGVGRRLKNVTVAEYQADQGRIFNRLSQLEYNQVLRYYRKSFGDLLDKQRLLR